MKATFRNSKSFQVASLMPSGLSHHPDKSQSFDVYRSEVISWLAGQPEILQYLFTKIKESGAIKYDPNSQTWGGINSNSNHE